MWMSSWCLDQGGGGAVTRSRWHGVGAQATSGSHQIVIVAVTRSRLIILVMGVAVVWMMWRESLWCRHLQLCEMLDLPDSIRQRMSKSR